MAAGELPTLAFGGVPEHFNIPFKNAIDEGAFKERGVDVTWTSIPGGTGAMMQKLRDGEVDVAVALTDGIIASLVKSPTNEFVVIGGYVGSPLQWAIVTGGDREAASVSEVKDGGVGVSRMGSGSHLMAALLAEREGWDASTLAYKVLGNIEGLVEGVRSGEAGFFMWEHFMTKPRWLSGELKHLGDIPTPWPAFLMVARREWLEGADGETRASQLRTAQTVIRRYAKAFVGDTAKAIATIHDMYGIATEDAEAWLRTVRFAADDSLSAPMLTSAMSILHRVGTIPKTLDPKELVDSRLVTLEANEALVPTYAPSFASASAPAAIVTASGLRFDSAEAYDEWRAANDSALKSTLDHLSKHYGTKPVEE